MKRIICILLLLLLLLCTGCSSVFGKTYDTGGLLLISQCLSKSEQILPKVEAIIEWQVKLSNEDIAAMKKSLAGEEYIPEDSSEEIRKKADELSDYIASFEKMKAEVDAIALTNVSQVDDTIAAAQHYFDKTTTALVDLMSIFDFYFDFEAALEPVNSFDDSAYSDASLMVSDMYDAISLSAANLETVGCPPFMEQTFSRYVKQFGTFNAVLESLYKVAALQTYEVYDVLRLYSIESLLARLDIQNTKYLILLTEDINLQCEKVSERLSTSLSVLHKELETNVGILAAHAG